MNQHQNFDQRSTRAPFAAGRWAELARAVALDPRTPVIIALSGGADSVFLLHTVAAARPRPRIVAVHVEHGLRKRAGLEDARFCERLCATLDIRCERRAIELDPHAPSLEARARVLRYRALCEVAAACEIDTILTGHHADDALETLLFRWMRGTQLAGLGGMRARLSLPPAHESSAADSGERLNPTARAIEIVRPLIAMRREEVRRSLRDHGFAWREDLSNHSARFTRNRVRNELLPQIEAACGPSAIENLRAFGAAVETLEEHCAALTAPLAWAPPLHAAARRGTADAELGGSLPRRTLMQLVAPLRRRALWRLLTEGTGRAPSRVLLDLLLDDLQTGRTSRHSLPGGWSLQLRSDFLHLEPAARPRQHDELALRLPARGALQPELPFPALLDAPFPALDAPGTIRIAQHDAQRGLRLPLPGILRLQDGRHLSAELVELTPGSDVLRSPLSVELDADLLCDDERASARTLFVRSARAGDRFHGLGAPGSKPLTRFLADAGVPREDRGHVPLVFHGDELVWVAGIRPCEGRRVRATTRTRLRLTLHHPSWIAPRVADAGALFGRPASAEGAGECVPHGA